MKKDISKLLAKRNKNKFFSAKDENENEDDDSFFDTVDETTEEKDENSQEDFPSEADEDIENENENENNEKEITTMKNNISKIKKELAVMQEQIESILTLLQIESKNNADSDEDFEKPKKKSKKVADDENDDEDKPKKKSKKVADDENDDDGFYYEGSNDDGDDNENNDDDFWDNDGEDDKPKKSKKDDDSEDNEKPKKKSKKVVVDDENDDEDKPKKKASKKVADDENDDEDKPKKSKKVIEDDEEGVIVKKEGYADGCKGFGLIIDKKHECFVVDKDDARKNILGESINKKVKVKGCPKGKWCIVKHKKGDYFIVQAKNIG